MDIADLDRLLTMLEELDGSDLHIKAGAPPRMRIAGSLRTLHEEPTFTAEDTKRIAEAMMTETVLETFHSKHEADYAYSVPGTGRFRVNAYYQRSSTALAIRRVRASPATAEELGLPPVVSQLAQEMRGLVLVTGPTGSGKTTTLAAMVDHINHLRACHIVTIEDPVEVLHKDDLAAIDQREVGFDTDSFSSAMRVILRQDPDVILVGEMRDQETVAAALSAAETGHLVFGTLHTQDAPQTIDRIIDVFPTQQQEQIRVMLASTLEGVVTQQLVPTSDGSGRAPCAEVLVCTSAVRNLIRMAKTHQIYSLMQVGGSFGMQTMDQGLANLVKEGIISEPIAYDRSSNEEDLRNHLIQ